MSLLLTKSYNTVLIITIVPLTLSPLCLLLLVRLGKTSQSFLIQIPYGRLHCEFVCLLFLRAHRKTDRFLAASRIQLAQSHFHFRRAAFSSQLKSKVGNILAKAAALRIMLNIDGAHIASRSHTHPSHTENSRLLTSSLSLGVPGPRTTQCM